MLALQEFEHPDHFVLFDEATLVTTLNGLPQSFREAIEIKKIGLSFKQRSWRYIYKPYHDNLIQTDSTHIPSLSFF